jgi:hypothetical protein
MEPFASRMPLNCGNQAGVVKYLRELLAGQGGGDNCDEFPTYSGGERMRTCSSCSPLYT